MLTQPVSNGDSTVSNGGSTVSSGDSALTNRILVTMPVAHCDLIGPIDRHSHICLQAPRAFITQLLRASPVPSTCPRQLRGPTHVQPAGLKVPSQRALQKARRRHQTPNSPARRRRRFQHLPLPLPTSTPPIRSLSTDRRLTLFTNRYVLLGRSTLIVRCVSSSTASIRLGSLKGGHHTMRMKACRSRNTMEMSQRLMRMMELDCSHISRSSLSEYNLFNTAY